MVFKKLTRAKYCSKILPDPYSHQLLLLIFPHKVSIHTGDLNKYSFFKVGRKGRQIQLEFYLSNQEIKRINELRKKSSELFQIKNLMKQTQFYEELEQFLSQERIPLLGQNEYLWEKMYFQSTNNVINYQTCEPSDLEMKSGVVPDINYMAYRQDYLNWKQTQVDQLHFLKKKLNLNDCYLACGQCKELLTKFSNLGERKENLVEVVIEENISEGVYRQEDKFYVRIYQSYKGVQFKVYACNNGHCFCFKPSYQQSYFLTGFSNLSLIYSDGTEEKLSVGNFDKKEIQRKELQAYSRRSKQCDVINPFISLQMEFICAPCQIFKRLENLSKILIHIRSKEHNENQEQFQKLLK